MPDANYFPASYDRTTRVVSTACVAIQLVVLALVVPTITQNMLVGLIVMLAIPVAIVLPYGYSPRGYTVANRTITVKRLFRDVTIPLDGVRLARRATGDDLRGCFRLCGSGGMFGYYGRYHTSSLGSCTWYVTARARSVVLVTESRTYLFSPDDTEGFLAAIRAEVPVPEHTSPAEPVAPPSQVGMWVGIAVGVIAVAIVIAAMRYSPGPPKFTLSDDTLAIHDRFYAFTLQAADADVNAIRVVDVRRDPEWHITARTNGFSNAHYHSGWYKVASGAKVRMYRADATRLVMIPPKTTSAPVLLEAEAPDSFAAELRRRWGKP